MDSTTKCRILVVDDNQDAADSLSQLLSLYGYEVHSVYNGTDAIEFSRQNNPNIVILDIGMPDMTGYDVAKAIKTKDNILIAVSGWNTKEHQRKSYEAGISLHFAKPVDPDHLAEMIGIGLGRKKESV